MPTPPNRIRYRSNGVILGKRNLGRKAQDQVTGFWTYEAYITTNAFGERVDQRGDAMDNRDDVYSVRQEGQ